jgi:DNA-binding PadR family transcriptional regulator
MSNEPGSYLPLSPAILHILISLAGEDRHGYGIMQEVALQSDGQYKLGPGTLYDNLQRLLDQGLVSEVHRKGEEDSRRRYYRLTSLGKRVVNAEIGRLEVVFRQAKVHLRPAKVAKA